MRSLGADHVIDYTREDFTKNGKQYDLILDVIAHRSVFAYRRALKPNGTVFLRRRFRRDTFPDLAPGTMDQKNHGQEHTPAGGSTE